MGRMKSVWLVLVAACGSTATPPNEPTPQAPPVETIAAADCERVVKERFEIDTSPEPKICVALFEAITSLPPHSQRALAGTQIARDVRGRCGDQCPDIATALMSDATLAFYDMSLRVLHVNDATFEGPRWKSGTPTKEQVDAYLAAVGVTWPDLVTRVRAIGGEVPADASFGDVRVLDAITRRGGPTLMGGEPTLTELIRHELAHGVQSYFMELPNIWTALTGWTMSDTGEVADLYRSRHLSLEQPIVASRLVLGLPRGASTYTPATSGFPTRYAEFDPLEDYAESIRIAHRDPAALARVSPVRFMLVATPAVLRVPGVRAAIVPGLKELLASDEPWFAMRTIEWAGDAILPEAAELADARPLPLPADVTEKERELITAAKLVVTVGGVTFRPTDEAFQRLFAQARADLAEMEAFERGLPDLGE